jgi:flavin reductase (DIM6/NTAB) family NADH-FMN oxidoreductase RutF
MPIDNCIRGKAGSRDRRRLLAMTATGLTAAGAALLTLAAYSQLAVGQGDEGGKLHAGTVNWVMQSAYKEPFFTIGVSRPGESFGFPHDDSLYAALTERKEFSLSLLSKDQTDAARAFMMPVEVEGNTINGLEFVTAMTGGPILTSAPAWLEARIEDQMEGPDHTLFLARVINAGNTIERQLLRDRDATNRPGGWLSNDPDP